MTSQPDAGFSERFARNLLALDERLGRGCTYDVLFLTFLQLVARFGYFSLGPITIDVRLVEDIVERTPASAARSAEAPDDYMRFSRLLMQEVRRSGRKRIDELHYLFAFMRCGEDLPARIFGELGVTPEQVEDYLRETGGGAPASPAERLLTPEQVAEYLQVNVQTVRIWIRNGRLPARRVAGLRALRVRFADVQALLKPLDEAE